MSKSAKLPEIRKGAFTKAREALGLSTKDLSGMSCFSVRQIEQIESGEISSFYGEQNKVTAAKKVASLLNLKEEDAFDFSGVGLTAKPVPDDEIVQAEEVKADVRKKSVPKNESKPSESGETKKVEAQSAQADAFKTHQPLGSIGNAATSKKVDPKKRLIFLLGIAAALVFSVINLRPLFFPEPPKEQELVLVEEVVQAPETEAKPDPAQAQTTSATAPVVPTPSAIAAAECPAADASTISYKPDAPKKAGDNVYLQSKSAQTVCVVDAAGKTQIKLLEPGVGVSVYGKPPFKVLTGGLNQVDLFYQGVKVRLANTGGRTIVLEPAELSQPAAPATTSDTSQR